MATSVQSPQLFINFRGKELRKSFVSYLERALRKDGFNVYIDETETRGEDLNIFFQRIVESKIALAIFSSQYTESRWYLDELVKIMECVDLKTLVVVPIFYKVETDHVKNLEGEFGKKFWKLAEDCKDGDVSKWRDALRAVPAKLGLTLGEDSNEGEFLEQIVLATKKVISNNVSTSLKRDISIGNPVLTPPFGMENRLEQLVEKLNYNGESTRIIGVVGMAGIGKTTLMELFYQKWKGQFRHRAFLGDVRERCKKGMISRSILVKDLLRGKNGTHKITDMPWDTLKTLLQSKKSLIVLDNVSHEEQIKVLLGERDWIRDGSLVFITTSDRSVIEGKVDDTYEVLRLNGRESLQCFNYYAFRGELCTLKGFINLSKKFVDYAKGNPLALTILGNELNGKDETYWKMNLSKLAQSPNKMIESVLRISYDELGMHQKDVFLDIACFFRSGDEHYVRCLVESCNTEPIDDVGEIKDLTSKFLINISGGRVEMHDLLYTFGNELGSQGSCRLRNCKDIVGAFKKKVGAEGAESVRGIFLDMSELKREVRLGRFTFTKMRNLRYLKLYSSSCHRECETESKLIFYEGLEFSLDEIRYLYWLKFPFDRLPEDFNPKNLIDLNLPYSEIEEVWEGTKETPKLKWVDLSHSRFLSDLSGLVNAESLQRLNLEGCTSLQELPKEMKRMKSLIFLNMRGCTGLCVLPEMNLISMKSLILTNCTSLKEFQVISDNIENLQLDGTAISQLPTNMVLLQKLIVLNLKGCKMLEAVPECLGELKALQELVLSGCSKLESFPIPLGNMKCLQILLLDGTALTDMPNTLQLNGSKMEDVPGLRCGMNDLSSLRRLCFSRNDKISNLQIDFSQLYHLRLLDLKYCKNLTSIPLLPPNLEILDAHGCEKLRTVASPMAALKLMEQVHSNFIFTNCKNLEHAAKNSITSYAQWKSQLDAVRCYKEGNVSKALLITSFPGSEVPSWFNHSSTGSTLELDFPPHWCDNRLSTIVLCAVVAFSDTQDEINRFSIECTYEFKNGTDTCRRFSCTLGGGWTEPRKIDSEHVFIGYTSCSHITNHVEGLSQSREHHSCEGLSQSREHHRCVPTKALIEFKVRDGAGEIVNCGLSLVYKEPKHIVIEENLTRTCSRSWS